MIVECKGCGVERYNNFLGIPPTHILVMCMHIGKRKWDLVGIDIIGKSLGPGGAMG